MIDVVKKDMQTVDVTEVDAGDRAVASFVLATPKVSSRKKNKTLENGAMYDYLQHRIDACMYT